MGRVREEVVKRLKEDQAMLDRRDKAGKPRRLFDVYDRQLGPPLIKLLDKDTKSKKPKLVE